MSIRILPRLRPAQLEKIPGIHFAHLRQGAARDPSLGAPKAENAGDLATSIC